MTTLLEMFEPEFLSEASYETRPEFKAIEKEFAILAEDYKRFYDGMKKRGMNPRNPAHVYSYYFSLAPDKEDRRVTQYNEHLKKIEDIVKKVFKFRAVNVELQLLNLNGPYTSMGNKTMITIPYFNFQTNSDDYQKIRDIGSKIEVDGKTVRVRIGYPSIIKASNRGIIDTSDAIVVHVMMQLYDGMTPEEYVGVLLHEIGHNIDKTQIAIEVANDTKMISVVSDAAKSSKLEKRPNSLKLMMQLMRERKESQKTYEEIVQKHAASMAKSVGYGGKEKYGELFADALPAAFGYGPAMIRALNKMQTHYGGDIKKDFTETKNLFTAMKNYRTALEIASELQRRENGVHGSNYYRLQVMLKSLKGDLAKCHDPAIKKRIQKNIDELELIAKEIIGADDDSKSEDLKKMLKVWSDGMKV